MLTRSIIFYELLFDYEFLQIQLKRFARFLLKCRCSINCIVHTRDYMTISRHRCEKTFLS